MIRHEGGKLTIDAFPPEPLCAEMRISTNPWRSPAYASAIVDQPHPWRLATTVIIRTGGDLPNGTRVLGLSTSELGRLDAGWRAKASSIASFAGSRRCRSLSTPPRRR